MSKILVFVLIMAFSGMLIFQVSPISHAQRSIAPPAYIVTEHAQRELRTVLQTYVTQKQTANLTYGVWQHGALIDSFGIGPVSQSNNETVSDTTIYRIRSMTKPVTAIGLLILMERGYFKLDDPITKFLPEFTKTETLADYDRDGNLYTYRAPYLPTMRQLLAHTAGFAYWEPNGGIIDRRLIAADAAISPNGDALVEALAQFPYIAMPGSEWNYSAASDLQGVVIERITGQSLAAFLQKELFEPLGMSDTGFHVPNEDMHRLSGVTRQRNFGFDYIEVEAADEASQGQVFDEGGHGLYSTQRDYFRFLNLLRQNGRVGDKEILSAETIDLFRSNAIVTRGEPGRQKSRGAGAGFGFGLGVGTIEDPKKARTAAPQGTYYWQGALGTWFWIDPVNDIVFIGLVQSDGALEPDSMKAAMAAVYGFDPEAIEARYASDGSG